MSSDMRQEKDSVLLQTAGLRPDRMSSDLRHENVEDHTTRNRRKTEFFNRPQVFNPTEKDSLNGTTGVRVPIHGTENREQMQRPADHRSSTPKTSEKLLRASSNLPIFKRESPLTTPIRTSLTSI